MTEPLSLSIRSRFGDYTATACRSDDARYRSLFRDCGAAIVDQRVWELHHDDPETFGALEHVLLQPATEPEKTPETCLGLCRKLLGLGFRRGMSLLAVGGGTIQDLATFTASILFRGVPWSFVPTTLVAQADSCLGGKSSLNLDAFKNQIGNFYPPRRILLVDDFFRTLPETEFRSGVGEVLKVHLLSGPGMVDRIETDLDRLLAVEEDTLRETIMRSLSLKAAIIDIDELDTGPRLHMNYGHSFGHALEAATGFRVPHGLAVTLGMDMANYLARHLGRLEEAPFRRLRDLLARNLRHSDWAEPDRAAFFDALRRDKKNRRDTYRFILPAGLGAVEMVSLPISSEIEAPLERYLDEGPRWF